MKNYKAMSREELEAEVEAFSVRLEELQQETDRVGADVKARLALSYDMEAKANATLLNAADIMDRWADQNGVSEIRPIAAAIRALLTPTKH